MLLFLQILGVLFLMLILGIVAIVLLIKFKLKAALESLGELGSSMTPARLHLEHEEAIPWKDESAVQQMAAPLAGLGFQLVGDYDTEEIHGLYLRVYVDPSQSIYAVVYEHPQAGVWMDMVSRYEDGSSVTYSNTSQGGGMDQRPGHSITREQGASPETMYERLLRERPQRPLAAHTAENFQAVFEKAYADEMDWRNSRGGPTEEEVRAVLRESGEEPTEEQIAQTREVLAQQALAGLQEALEERFQRETTLTVPEWEEVEDRLVYIHDRLPPDMVLETFNDWVDEDSEAAMVPPAAATPREAFAILNTSLPEGRRFKKVGQLSEPVETDVYAGPEEE